MKEIISAIGIAESNLRACYGKKGIFAGLKHFKDYWARDSFFASFGSIVLKDYEIVRSNIDIFLKAQDSSGQIPLRIGKSSAGIVLSYMGLSLKAMKRSPVYNIDKSSKKPVDQNSLMIISCHEYMKDSKDTGFIAENIYKIEKAMAWNLKQDNDNDSLIEEEEYCNWADSIKKKGKVLYTNVCHCHALFCLSDMFSKLGDKKKADYYLSIHTKTKEAINKQFWNGEHYIDWIDKEKQYSYFSTDGNMLAIIWGIAEKERTKHVEESMHIFRLDDIPSGCVHPPYPKTLISLQTRLLGLKDYHNGLSWLWLGAISAIARHKAGMKKEAVKIIKKMSEMILENGEVYEVYDKNCIPVSRAIYKAEHPFAWSSGMFIYACKEVLGDQFSV